MSDSVKTGLLAAYYKLLRPLIRILLRHGITYAEISEVIKRVYVQTAAEEFRVPGKKMTKARIAIVTGLTRKEVQRIAAIKEEGKCYLDGIRTPTLLGLMECHWSFDTTQTWLKT